jgi:hypothetical protein
VEVADLGPLDAQCFALAVDAFGTGALGIDGLVEGTLAIQGHPHLPAQFPIEVLDTAFLFEELGMVARLTVRFQSRKFFARMAW